MKKRALSLILALLLAVGLGVPALAAEEAETGTETDGDGALAPFSWARLDDEDGASIRDLLALLPVPDLRQDYTWLTDGTAACDFLVLLLAISPAVTILAAEVRETAEAGDANALRLTQVHYTWLDFSGKTREGTDVYAYEDGGTLPSSVTRNSGVPFSFEYDEQGRVLTGEGFTCSYDEDGRLIEKRTDSSGVYVYRHDEDGRLQGFSWSGGELLPEYSAECAYTYAPDGRSAAVTWTYDHPDNTSSYDYTVTFDDAGRVTGDEQARKAYSYAPQLRIGYCSADTAERITEEYGGFDLARDQDNTTFQLDVLDAAGEPITSYGSLSGWIPPIELAYDDAGYLAHAESSNGCVADFTYEPAA